MLRSIQHKASLASDCGCGAYMYNPSKLCISLTNTPASFATSAGELQSGMVLKAGAKLKAGKHREKAREKGRRREVETRVGISTKVAGRAILIFRLETSGSRLQRREG